VRWLPLGIALVAICASIASFIVLLENPSRSGWWVFALNRGSYVLVLVAIALPLAVERRPTGGAWQAQIVAVAVSLAFAIVALVKLYTGSRSDVFPNAFAGADEWGSEASIVALGALALGLIGRRVATSAAWISFVAATCAAIGCAIYAISLEFSSKGVIWYEVAATAAALGGSAAARTRRR
jgi:hypothetical protein